MNNSNKAVFFDCWDTVISFQERTPSWNVEPLKKHALNPEEINFKAVEDYSERFLRDYMNSRMFYEIDAVQFYNLMVYNFNIKLDCTTKECIHEILNHLNPEPLEGIMDFLKRLERDNIYYAILSNTIYDEDDTFAIIKRKLPDAHFNFFLGSSKIAVKKPYELFFNTGLNLAHKRKEDSIYTFLLKSPKQNHIEQQTNQQIQSSIPTKSTHKKKSPHFCTKALQQTKAASIPPIEVLDFKLRIAQCSFVLEKVRQLLEKGTPGERIVVITPDEAFSQYLALLDSANNLNYAMGTKLSTSPKHLLWCEKLEQILNEIPPSNTSRLQYLESIFAYIFALEPIEPNAVLTPILDSRVLDSLPPCPFSERLRTQILEILFEYHQIQTEIEQLCYADLIHMLFRQIKDLSLDDIKGGKVRVMGILETREITCDYAIVVDFNENFIPHIKDSDMFLNTFIRKTLSMPTLQDRQDLQKHYYYQLFTNTKYQIFITYTKNDQTGIASMIDELLLQQHISLHYTNGDTHYALFKPSAIRAYKEEEIIGTIQKCTFSPTSINTFIACKRRFYYRYILHLEEFKETNQKKDIGIILHKALEEVYKPYINQYINENTLNTIIKSFEQKLEDTFALESHSNTLQYQISRFEMQGFWEKEREYAYICGKKGFMLLDCEREFQATLTHNGVQHNIRGIIDRLDKANDAYRIIDYKYAKKPCKQGYQKRQKNFPQILHKADYTKKSGNIKAQSPYITAVSIVPNMNC